MAQIDKFCVFENADAAYFNAKIQFIMQINCLVSGGHCPQTPTGTLPLNLTWGIPSVLFGIFMCYTWHWHPYLCELKYSTFVSDNDSIIDIEQHQY